MFTARAAARRTVTAETPDSVSIRSFVRRVKSSSRRSRFGDSIRCKRSRRNRVGAASSRVEPAGGSCPLSRELESGGDGLGSQSCGRGLGGRLQREPEAEHDHVRRPDRDRAFSNSSPPLFSSPLVNEPINATRPNAFAMLTTARKASATVRRWPSCDSRRRGRFQASGNTKTSLARRPPATSTREAPTASTPTGGSRLRGTPGARSPAQRQAPPPNATRAPPHGTRRPSGDSRRETRPDNAVRLAHDGHGATRRAATVQRLRAPVSQTTDKQPSTRLAKNRELRAYARTSRAAERAATRDTSQPTAKADPEKTTATEGRSKNGAAN